MEYDAVMRPLASVWVVTEYDCGNYYGETAAICTSEGIAQAIAARFGEASITERVLDECFSEGCE